MLSRLSWANGPVADSATKQLPNTSIFVASNYVEGMPYLHVRCSHAAPGSGYPDEDDWTWYTRWRDLRQAHGEPVCGIAIDEVRTNQENVAYLIGKMVNVWYWCESVGIARPDWLVAITPGNVEALDYVIRRLTAQFGSRVFWFPETYIGTYKADAGESDDGVGNAHTLLERMIAGGVHERTIYGINHSHYCPTGRPVSAYYNVYGTLPTESNPIIADAVAQFVREVVARDEPFGFGVWTPGYSSEITRANVDAALTAVGC